MLPPHTIGYINSGSIPVNMKSLRALAFTSYAHFTNDGFYLLFPLLITYYSKLPHVNISFLGFIAVIYAVLSGLLSPKIGAIADRYDNDAAMIGIGLSVYALAIVVLLLPFIFAGYFYMLVILGAVILGVAQSFYHPIGATILSYSFGRKAPTEMGINGSAGSLGRSVVSGLFVLAVAVFGIATGMFALATFALVSALVVYAGLSYFRRGKQNRKKPERRTPRRKREMGKYRSFITLLMAIVFMRAMFLAGTVTFIPKYLDIVLNSSVLMGAVVSFSFFFAVLGQLAFGYITSRMGGKFSILLTSVFPGIAFMLFLLSGSNVYMLAATYSIFTFFAFTGFPVLLGYVNQVVPKSISTTAGGDVWGLGQYVGNGAGIAVISALILAISVYSALWVMLVFLVPSIALIAFLPGRGKIGIHAHATRKE